MCFHVYVTNCTSLKKIERDEFLTFVNPAWSFPVLKIAIVSMKHSKLRSFKLSMHEMKGFRCNNLTFEPFTI